MSKKAYNRMFGMTPGKTYKSKAMASLAAARKGGFRANQPSITVQPGEWKYFDASKGATSIAVSTDWTGTEVDPGTLNCLFMPAVGTGINQRVGRKVNLYKIKVRGTILCAPQADQTGGDARSVVRLILYQDMQTNGTFAQGEDVMDGSSATAALVVNAFQNVANFGRFRVWKDKLFVFQNANITWDGTNLEQQGLAKTFKFNINLNGLQINFNSGSAGSVADIVNHSFHMIATTDSGSFVPQIVYNVRCTYKDA